MGSQARQAGKAGQRGQDRQAGKAEQRGQGRQSSTAIADILLDVGYCQKRLPAHGNKARQARYYPELVRLRTEIKLVAAKPADESSPLARAEDQNRS